MVCEHAIVVKREARWTKDFIEEFPTYRCRDCHVALNWRDIRGIVIPMEAQHHMDPDCVMAALPLSGEHDADVCHYAFMGTGRLILETLHGQVIIDVRPQDVNAFVVGGDGQRVDSVLLKARGSVLTS